MSDLKEKQEFTAEDKLGFHDIIVIFLKRALIMLIYGLLIAGIGLVISFLITNYYQHPLQDVTFIVGIAVLIIGILMMMKGNPAGVGMSSMGMKNANQVNYMNLEATLRERERTNYNRDFKNHSIVELAPHRISLILGGGLLILFSVLFL